MSTGVATTQVTATGPTSTVVTSTTGTTGIVTSTTSTTSTFSSTAVGTSSSSTASITCYPAPDALFAEDGGVGVYCPFSAVDGGADINCAIGQHCCEPPTTGGASACTSEESVCTALMSTNWICEGTPDCAGQPGTLCCGQGIIATQAPQPGCAPDGGTLGAYPYASGFYGTACQASCTSFGNGDAGAPAFQVCSKDSECATGTCVPIRPKGNSIGYCASGS